MATNYKKCFTQAEENAIVEELLGKQKKNNKKSIKLVNFNVKEDFIETR